ncbi:MAG: hypothetical protein OHK0019_14330 [Saprospiraceae bacterium]
MQDNDFDKIFSHKFGQLPGEPYSEANWSELSRRLDERGRRQWRWLLPALFFLLGFLAAGNVFWWYQWREANDKMKDSKSQTTFFHTDTITRRTVIYRYDTIYQNVTLVQRQNASAFARLSPTSPSNSFAADNLYSKNTLTADANPFSPIPASIESPAVPIVQDSVKQQLANGDAAAPAHTIVHKTHVDSSEQAMLPPLTENVADDTIFDQLLKNQPTLTKKSQSPFLYFTRPRLGFSAVWGLPSIPHKISSSIGGGGIRADAEIARNFRLGGEIDFQQASLKADETTALENSDIEIPEPGGDFQLKYWEIYFLPTFTYNLHLRYEIPLRGNWTPWVGLGGQAATYLPFEVEYEFENANDNLELHIPAKSEASTRWQGMMLMLGAECRLKPRLFFGAESYLLRSFRKEPGLLDNQFGLKTSLFYKF